MLFSIRNKIIMYRGTGRSTGRESELSRADDDEESSSEEGGGFEGTLGAHPRNDGSSDDDDHDEQAE